MKRSTIRLRWLVPLSVVLVPLLFWVLVLTIAPTGWARSRIVARLSQATGRPIHLGRLKIGVLGGVHLTNLEIGAPGGGADPWLKVARTAINVNAWQLLIGHVDPSEVDVSGVALRVLRRRDGRLELADLLRPRSTDAGEPEGHEDCLGPTALEIHLHDAKVTVIDEPSGTRLELTAVEGHATCQGRVATLHELQGTLNGGVVELAASIDRTDFEPVFEARLRCQGVGLGQGAGALLYLVPVLSETSGSKAIRGQLEANVYLKGQGASRVALRRSLLGQGKLRIDPVTLEGTRLLAELDARLNRLDSAKVGAVTSDFLIRRGGISTENLTLTVGRLPLVLAGRTDFDGALDYHVRNASLASRLPSKARDFLADLSIDVKDLSLLRIDGTVDAMRFSVDRGGSEPVGKGPESLPRGNNRQDYREIGRRLRERLLR